MKRFIAYFIVALVSLMLTACGFHLRGTNNTQLSMKDMSVSAGDKYSFLTKELRKRLTESGVKIHDDSQYKLVVTEGWDSRNLSFSNAIRGTEIEKVLLFNYSIYGTGGLLLISNSLEVRGVYIYDTNNIVANEQQENSLNTRLYEDAITLLMERLQSISAEQLDKLQQAAEEQQRLKLEAEKAQQKSAEKHYKSLIESIPLDKIEQHNEQN